MQRTLTYAMATAMLFAATVTQAQQAQGPQPEATTPRVQLAILLDTSGSMDGLIEQAKAQLWKIVNEMATARQNGRVPEMNVALYEYGKSTISAEQGYLRQILPLTTDLDRVSEELFALATNGGDEYCGQVIQAAVSGLQWSDRPEDFKVIFIAGNEPFTQGPVDYSQACKAAIEKGIIVNTIFCGPHDEGRSTSWQHGAQLADGSYASIDQNQAVVHIEAPQDKQIAELGVAINKTYVAYGSHAEAAAQRQVEQDNNAYASSLSSAQQRAVCKASSNYFNGAWDLVDACQQKDFKLADLKPEQLPEEMRKMTEKERVAYLDGKRKSRVAIQKQIRELNAEREKYVAAERAKRGEDDSNSLDAVVTKALREQAVKRNFNFK